ncbi:MAG: hypothetical protein CMO55_20020 [Verrucomicrobiales bacterium]|nr:hypothetical protein [Verrucomicrobiales bacterium]
MKSFLSGFFGVVAFAFVCPAYAFLPNPDLLTISPSVAKAGTTVEVSISGKDIEEAETLRFSSAAIKVEPVMLPADEFHPTPRPVEGKFKVTIPKEVEPTVYEVRSKGYFGLSTARPFLVVPADGVHIAEEGDHSTAETAMSLDVNAGLLGTLAGGKFDWYSVTAKKGQRLLIEVIAERLDSKADVLLAVSDVAGVELETSRHHFGRDPFIDFTAPADGTYHISVTDTLYSGGKEYFYHIQVSDGPHVDFVFPPAGEPGQKRRFTFFGRNLPEGSLGEGHELNGKKIETVEKELVVPADVTVPASFHPGVPRQGMLPGFEASLGNSNSVRVGFATAPVVEENAEAEEQSLTVPCEVAGRFNEPSDYDVFRFQGKKGATYWIDVVSHRMGTVADPYILVEKVAKDKGGNETFTKVAENDDLPSFFSPDALNDLNADSYDPGLSFTPDADGDYRVSLFNQSADGSLAHLYRLAIREALPDFQIIAGHELTKTINNDAYPAAPLLRRGGSMIYRIMAFRQDGFDGDITITAKGLPKGVTAKPLVLSGDSREGFLTLWSEPDAPAWSGKIELEGKAKVGDKEVVRMARPASLIWGTRVFGYASQVRSRLDLENVLSVIESETEPTRLTVAEDKVWEVEMDGTLEIPLKTIETGKRVGNLQVNVHGFPGILRSPPSVAIGEKDKEAKLSFPFKKTGNFDLKPGTYQFVLQGVGNAKYSQNPAAAEKAKTEVERLKKISEAIPSKVTDAKNELAKAEKSLAEAKQKEAGAADDKARQSMKEATAQAQKQVDESKKKVQEEEAKVAEVKKLVDASVKVEQKASATASEKTNQFATFSMPITVVVKEKAEKK